MAAHQAGGRGEPHAALRNLGYRADKPVIEVVASVRCGSSRTAVVRASVPTLSSVGSDAGPVAAVAPGPVRRVDGRGTRQDRRARRRRSDRFTADGLSRGRPPLASVCRFPRCRADACAGVELARPASTHAALLMGAPWARRTRSVASLRVHPAGGAAPGPGNGAAPYNNSVVDVG
jgi:hypothetical protein